jgi:hypothetical protein
MGDGESSRTLTDRIEYEADLANAERAGVEAGLRLLRNQRAMTA